MHSLGWSVLFSTQEVRTDIPTNVLRRRIQRISDYLKVETVNGHQLCRVGAKADGGYVMVDNFLNIDGVLSLGVGPDVSWDDDISQFVKVIHLYDHSVEKLPKPIANATWFKEKIVTRYDSTGTSLETAVSRLLKSDRLILKCDIEDAEWAIIAEADEELLKKFDQIVIEFHWMINHLNSDSFTTMLNALEKISSTHKVVNIHANNYANYEIVANCPIPDVIEVSYARKSSYSFIEKTLVPDFNVKNYSEHPEISLQFPLIGQ